MGRLFTEKILSHRQKARNNMTRKEAIKNLQEIIEEGWLISDFDKCTAIDACEMAIKALEQESVLDKIRTEIISLTDGDIPERIWNVDVLEILDKYGGSK